MNHPAWTPRRVAGLIAYAVIGVGMLILFISDAQQDRIDAKRPAEIAAAVNEAQDKTIRCVVKALRADASQTKDLREVVQRKDEDLAFAIEAMVVLVRDRVLGLNATSPAIRQAGEQFITQAENFLDESDKVTTAREQNPVPNKICGVVIE